MTNTHRVYKQTIKQAPTLLTEESGRGRKGIAISQTSCSVSLVTSL